MVAQSVSAILFDKDGTLFRVESRWRPWIASLIDARLSARPEEGEAFARLMAYDAEARLFGSESPVAWASSARLAPLLKPFIGATISVETLKSELDAMAEGIAMTPVVALGPFLYDLKRQGFALGVATNDTQSAASIHLARAGVLELFDFVAGYDSGYGSKPQSGMAQAFLKAVDTDPASAMIVGDTVYDLITARSIGAQAVGVLSGSAAEPELRGLADVILKDIGGLRQLLAVA